MDVLRLSTQFLFTTLGVFSSQLLKTIVKSVTYKFFAPGKRTYRHSIALIVCIFIACCVSGCAENQQETKTSKENLEAGQRYRVEKEDLVLICDNQPVFVIAQKNNYWIRLGHEPEVTYYKGEILCEECNYNNERSFFEGSRIYIDPIDSSFAIYNNAKEAEIKILCNENSYDIQITLKQRVSRKSTQKLINAVLDLFFTEANSISSSEMQFYALPTEEIQIGGG